MCCSVCCTTRDVRLSLHSSQASQGTQSCQHCNSRLRASSLQAHFPVGCTQKHKQQCVAHCSRAMHACGVVSRGGGRLATSNTATTAAATSFNAQHPHTRSHQDRGYVSAKANASIIQTQKKEPALPSPHSALQRHETYDNTKQPPPSTHHHHHHQFVAAIHQPVVHACTSLQRTAQHSAPASQSTTAVRGCCGDQLASLECADELLWHCVLHHVLCRGVSSHQHQVDLRGLGRHNL